MGYPNHPNSSFVAVYGGWFAKLGSKMSEGCITLEDLVLVGGYPVLCSTDLNFTPHSSKCAEPLALPL